MRSAQGLPDKRGIIGEYNGHLIVPTGDAQYTVAERVGPSWVITCFTFDSPEEAERFLDMHRTEMKLWFEAGMPSLDTWPEF